MKKILVTGATGNIGSEVIHHLYGSNSVVEIIAAVRNIEKAQKEFSDLPGLSYRQFDFSNFDSFGPAFEGIDTLFLLRPPHISEVEKYFRPLLESARESGIREIAFLSVQGAEKSRVIPHNKIEALIRELGFHFIFVRPSYFMQNLSTTLRQEILDDQSITLPSGKAKFNWIDARDIGEAAANLMLEFEQYQDEAYDITGTENKNFTEAAALMTEAIGKKITYRPVNPISFYLKKRKEGIKSDFAIVMTILHFLPRIQKEPEISDNFEKLTGRKPTTLLAFLKREKEKFSR